MSTAADEARKLIPDLSRDDLGWSGTAFVSCWGSELDIHLTSHDGVVEARQLDAVRALLSHAEDIRPVFERGLFDYYQADVDGTYCEYGPDGRPGGCEGIFLRQGALRAALEAKARGTRLWVESVLPHFLLDKTYAERPGVEGMKHVMSPPLRHRRNQKILWDALAAGLIDTVGTDHCPFDTAQKLLGQQAFTQIPNGIPGIEERVSLLYTYGVKRGTKSGTCLP